jgi:hypothetical protein
MGCRAIEAGASYHFLAPANGKATLGANTAPGLYFVQGDVIVSGINTPRALTVVATGSIKFGLGNGNTGNLTPFVDELLGLANGTSSNALIVDWGGLVNGSLQAVNGGMAWKSGHNHFVGQLAAGTINLGGVQNVFVGAAPSGVAHCAPAPVAASPATATQEAASLAPPVAAAAPLGADDAVTSAKMPRSVLARIDTP